MKAQKMEASGSDINSMNHPFAQQLLQVLQREPNTGDLMFLLSILSERAARKATKPLLLFRFNLVGRWTNETKVRLWSCSSIDI